MKYGDLITLVVPVYNRAHLIQRSVGSLCTQSYRNLEILIVDDRSTDEIEAAVVALADPRVRLVRRAANGGAAAARNTGVALARSEWIGFHDSDDICVFDRIERQVHALLALPEDYVGVHCARLGYFDTREDTYRHSRSYIRPEADMQDRLSGDVHRATIRKNFISVPTMLLRKSAITAAGPFDEKLRNNEDWDFTLRLTAVGKFGFVPEPLYLTVLHLPRPQMKATHISENDRYSARSFVRITGKLRRAGAGPADLALHYASAARLLLRQGRTASARRFVRAAFGGRPTSPTIWRLYLMTYAPWLYPLLRRLRNG